jgi:hypothetical protein
VCVFICFCCIFCTFSYLILILILILTQSSLLLSFYSISCRTIRILRLVRVFRAARLLKRIADRSSVIDVWVLPKRYSQTNSHEVRTIAGILRVLSQVHERIQDRKLTSCIQSFVVWYEADMTGKFFFLPCILFTLLITENLVFCV